MQHQSCSELQGVSTQQGASTRRTPTKQATIPGSPPRTSPRCWSSRLRKGPGCLLCPPEGALLWAWLLVWALVVPGVWSSLNEEQEELIVELHNYYRGQVSPSASAMLPLRWDPSLKLIAEGYAAKCIWNHNPDLEETGENLFAGTGPLDLREALEKWFMEHLDFDYHNNSCPEDTMCGHYTQMVWADTHSVGCAFHLCNTMEGLDFERTFFLVCNYYPAGNYEDQKPYVEGDWCSRCPDELQKCENNMCVPDLEPEEEESEDTEEEEWTVLPPEATVDSSPPPATTSSSSSSSSNAQDSADSLNPAILHPALGTEPPSAPQPTQENPQEEEEEGGEEEGREEEGGEEGRIHDEKREETERRSETKGHDLSHHRHREELHFLDEYGQPITVQVEGRRGCGHRKRRSRYATECSIQTERHWEALRAMRLVEGEEGQGEIYSSG
ncbi:uncharacterized protein ACJ7VT_013213 [Polymixia lowei]